MTRLLVLALLAATALGCETTRPWQTSVLATHDRQMAFDATKDVLAKHFEVARANWSDGTLETKPQLFEGKKAGTLADVRGAGGRWRRIVYCEIDRDGLGIVAHVAVLQQRETSAAGAAVAYGTGQPERASGADKPPLPASEYERPVRLVWTDAGYDAGLAREVLAEIVQNAEQAEGREAKPELPTGKDIVEDSKKYAVP